MAEIVETIGKTIATVFVVGFALDFFMGIGLFSVLGRWLDGRQCIQRINAEARLQEAKNVGRSALSQKNDASGGVSDV